MNYSLILDLPRLENFVETFLPDLKREEMFLITLFARKKYCPSLKIGDKTCLKRLTANKKNLISKIRQMECAMGSYVTQHNEPIPQEALAVYITVNPRNLEKAAINGTKALLNLITKTYTDYNPHQIVLSEIQKAQARSVFVDFDFDAPYTEDFLDRLKDNLNPNCYNILITKNGFHVLVRPQLVDAKFQKTWFSYLNLMPECDVTGDSLIPIPGCSQGNFNPYLLMS